MPYSRREILKLGLATLPAASLLSRTYDTHAASGNSKPNSNFGGVQIGIIAPYSLRGMSGSAEDILSTLVELGISAVELQNDPVERFAGAPSPGMRGGAPGAIPGASSDQQKAVAEFNGTLAEKSQAVAASRRALAEASFTGVSDLSSQLAELSSAELKLAQARAEGVARLQNSPQRLNPQQMQALMAQSLPQTPTLGRGGPGAANTELTRWRAGASMDKFKALRKLYNDAGVSIYGFKLELRADSPESDYEYAFNVCETLGANQLTMELPRDPAASKRIGEYAAKRKIWVGYHAHTQGSLTAWDKAFNQSPYNGANIDIGHYTAGPSGSPLPFIEKHHARITSMHMKDRKLNEGPNLPWGQGDTPIREVLQLMKRQQWKFPATIELEYNVPEGSTVVAELAKCLQFCKAALA